MGLRTRADFGRDRQGATSIEYGLIISLIFLAILGATQRFSEANKRVFNAVETEMKQAHTR